MSSRRKTSTLDPWRNNHLNFLQSDPEDIEVKETSYAGKGLFAKRYFQKHEFIVNYRGQLRGKKDEASGFEFDLGKPRHQIIDATDLTEARGRFINDIDPFHPSNCFPEKFVLGEIIGIKFVANKAIECGEEFRYDYGFKTAPWRKIGFFKETEEKKVESEENVKGAHNEEDERKRAEIKNDTPCKNQERKICSKGHENKNKISFEVQKRIMCSEEQSVLKSITGQVPATTRNEQEELKQTKIRAKSKRGIDVLEKVSSLEVSQLENKGTETSLQRTEEVPRAKDSNESETNLQRTEEVPRTKDSNESETNLQRTEEVPRTQDSNESETNLQRTEEVPRTKDSNESEANLQRTEEVPRTKDSNESETNLQPTEEIPRTKDSNESEPNLQPTEEIPRTKDSNESEPNLQPTEEIPRTKDSNESEPNLQPTEEIPRTKDSNESEPNLQPTEEILRTKDSNESEPNLQPTEEVLRTKDSNESEPNLQPTEEIPRTKDSNESEPNLQPTEEIPRTKDSNESEPNLQPTEEIPRTKDSNESETKLQPTQECLRTENNSKTETNLKQTDLNIDLFEDFNIGGNEEVTDVDMIDISGDISFLNEERQRENANHSNSSDSESSENVDDEHDHEESLTCNSTPIAKNNKPKRPVFESCLICDKSVKKMRDHLNYSHKLQTNPVLKSFLSSYYSTLKTKRCYHCENCTKRLGFKPGHPKHHHLIRIFNRKDPKSFPESIQIALKGYQGIKLKHYSEIVEDFDKHCQGLINDGEVTNVSKMSASLKNFIAEVISQTKEFEETTKLSVCVRNYQESYALKRITIGNYLSKLKKFFNFIELHAVKRFPHFKEHPWEKILDEVRSRMQLGAQKEAKRTRKHLQRKVPSLTEVQQVNSMVVNFLNKDLADKKLKYRELCAMNFMVLSFRLNCRSGVLLNLTWEDVHTIKKTGSLETDRHKTGRFYDVTVKIEADQQTWLKRLRKQYIREFKTHSDLVFPTSCNTVDHSMSRTIRSVLNNLFGDAIEKDFHANSVRKMWDTHFYSNREAMGAVVFNSHLEQTGHTEATAIKNYVVPGDKTKTLNIYLSALSNLEQSSVGTESTEECSSSSSLLRPETPGNKYKNASRPRNQGATPRDHGNEPRNLATTPQNERATPRNQANAHQNPATTSQIGSATPLNQGSRPRNPGTTPQIESADPLEDTSAGETPIPTKRPHRSSKRVTPRGTTRKQESESEADLQDEDEKSEYEPDEDSEAEEFTEIPKKVLKHDSRRQRYINSLKSSRQHKPSLEEQKCLALFFHLKEPIKKSQLIATIKKSGIKIDEEIVNRVYNKVKFACNQYLKTSLDS